MKSKVQIVRFDQIQFMDKYLSGIPTLWDCCKTPRSRHSSQHYRSLLSVSEFNVGRLNGEIGILQQSHYFL